MEDEYGTTLYSQTPLRDALLGSPPRKAVEDTAQPPLIKRTPADEWIETYVKKPQAPPANPKQHYGDKKLPLALVPFSFVAHVSVALYEGMRKYGLVNWRASKVEAMTYVSALDRHVKKWVNGERADPVTKVHHLANAAACLAILLDAELNGSLIDNRPQACENTDKMILELESVLENLKVLYSDQSPKHYYMKEGGE